MTEENLLKGQRGHGGHPGGESIPRAACPGHGVCLPSVFLPKQVVVSGLRSQRHDLVSCQLSQLVCEEGNKTWLLPHPCPSSAPRFSWALIMREALALLLYNYAEHSPSLNIGLRP